MVNEAEKNVEIAPYAAKKIIECVGGAGNPPEYGFQYFTAGLDDYLKTIDEEYLRSFIKDGGSTFKMVVGIYGGGKTHFLYCIRENAWKYNYITSYIELSPEQTPFHKLDQVYKAIVANLIYPQTADELLSGYERGIEAVIKTLYNRKYTEISNKLSGDAVLQELNSYASSIGPYESTSFRNAVKESFLSLAEKRDDDFTLIMQWLKGENPPKNMLKDFKIFEKIEKSTAFKMIRSLVQWTQEIGYSGLIVLMDEAEQTSSMSSKQKSILLNNLRELIDECGHSNFMHTMWFYSVPDENFLEGRTQIYEALRQRVSEVFDTEIKPPGVKIYLEKSPMDAVELLIEIGRKLAPIYEKAYNAQFNTIALEETLRNIAKAAYERRREIGHKRLFVQKIVKAFDKLQKDGKPVSPEDIRL
jgi:hypothetical protein